jgi:glutathione S-transferase
MLKLLGRSNSINVQKVLWALDECGLAYERTDVGRQFGFPEGYEKLNMNKLVPTLIDGDLVLWESNAIVRYLAREHGIGKIASADPKAFANADRWMDWQATVLYPAIQPAFVHLYRLPVEKRDMAVVKASYEKTLQVAQQLDTLFATQDYIAGDNFSMADIPVGATVQRWFNMPFAEYGQPELVNLRRYYQRLQSRKAFAQFVDGPLT